ncbi:MAG: polynucleotide kinase-phosphatase [Microscillaceae bacterium]|nr:polynucleotide kinase-phosphatase [Microscillaceae bacterium]
MQIRIPELALVTLVGVSSSGKSTFAGRHFLSTEIISSDLCRALVSDEENNMEATQDAFDLVHYLIAKRLKRGRLTVVDATNVQAESRKPLVQLAQQYHCIPIAIVFHLPESLLKERHQNRPDRNFADYVLFNQSRDLKRSLKMLKKEGFRQVYVLNSVEEVDTVQVIREPLWNNLKSEKGPFDIIGDIHGCFEELCNLLEKLGYIIQKKGEDISHSFHVSPPDGRKAVFLGDLVDRGPNSPDVLRLVMSMVKAGTALCVPGNHDMKFLKKLQGKNVQIRHGLAETLEQIKNEPDEFVQTVKTFLDSLISHYVLDEGRLVVAHAGLREEMQGRGSANVRDFCLYGETTGEIDEFGLPVRYNWAAEYKGTAMVVYGHTPIPEPEWLNNTLNIDTGCVFGGKLTALRYPEKELLAVGALNVYCEPIRPLSEPPKPLNAQQEIDDLLDIQDVIGKRLIYTRFNRQITIREENAITALEVMSRFAINPKWLIYLPPTMSPTETSSLPHLLEHPQEAFDYYKNMGIEKVVCEEKHMGSRAVVIVCKNENIPQEHFGIMEKSLGICYTRTGRRFFNKMEVEQAFLYKINQALSQSNFWDKMHTDWVCLDGELMPWSVKAQELIKSQYASVQASASHSLKETLFMIEKAQNRELDLTNLYEQFTERQTQITQYTQAYRNYCREVESVDDLILAPFHILATDGQTHYQRDHLWHMHRIAEFCRANPEMLLETKFQVVDLNDSDTQQEAIKWWEDLTANGGEGLVIKSLDFMVNASRGIIQPAIKCRGREYLRIIYGPEYTHEKNLKKLKKRGLSRKRSLATREFVLGLEALERFVQKEPLRRVHECVFGILALESEEVDPRL